MANTRSLHLNDFVFGRIKRSTPQQEPAWGWLTAAIEGLRAGQAAQHAYSRLRARGVPSQNASRIVLDEFFTEKN